MGWGELQGVICGGIPEAGLVVLVVAEMPSGGWIEEVGGCWRVAVGLM